MNSAKIPRSLGTHDGTFHADEVTACALMLLFNLVDEDKIVRTRDLAKLHSCEYVCDVGGIYDPNRKLFDHHQQDYQGSFSSAGMILLYLEKTGILTEKERDYFNQSLIIGVDAHDNGKEMSEKGVCTYSHVISNFTPLNYDAGVDEQHQAFFEALRFSKAHLDRMWRRYQYVLSCRQIVAEAMKQEGECMIFDKSLPWLDSFFEMGGLTHQAKFLIMPSDQHWKLRGIPPSLEEKMKVRIPLPDEWAGLLTDHLREVSGIEGAIFCHKGKFISVWETREAALKALDYVLKQHKNSEGS